VAKSIAVLQILENLPVTAHNIAALLQPTVASPSLKDEVEKAIDAMLKDNMIPLGEKNGSLRFLTQAAITLQKQFDQIEYRQADVRAEFNGVLRPIFKPLPSARLHGVRPVTAGLKIVVSGGQSVSLEGEKEAIQIHVEFVPSSSYEKVRTERENDSRASRERATIYLLGRADSEADQLAVTLVRCRKFLDQYRNTSDSETKEFVRIVNDRLTRTATDLERKLQAALVAGSFVAHGAYKPVSECGVDVLGAAKTFLEDAAARVFDRYNEAPHQADSGVAEKFLKTQLDRTTSNEDPLGLVSRSGRRAQIKLDHKALISIKDFLGQQGQVEGRRLLDHFADPGFGWSKDTTRYLLAAAFLGGEIKLRIAGVDHVVKNDDTLNAFSSNRAIGPVGIALRQERPDPEALVRASDRLRDLTGENILPLEDEIATAAKKYFPTYQAAFGPLAVELRSLGLESADQAERAENLANDLTQVVSGDGSDAVKRLGGVDSPLYDSLMWARKLKKALDNGLRANLSHLKRLRQEIDDFTDSGIPAKLKASAAETLASVTDILSRESFFEEAAALGTMSNELDKLVAGAIADLARQQKTVINDELVRWQSSADWTDLTEDDRSWFSNEVVKLPLDVDGTLNGLKKILGHDYTINNRLRDLSNNVGKKAAENRTAKAKDLESNGDANETKSEVSEAEVLVPKIFTSVKEIDMLIAELNKLRLRVSGAQRVRITWKEID